MALDDDVPIRMISRSNDHIQRHGETNASYSHDEYILNDEYTSNGHDSNEHISNSHVSNGHGSVSNGHVSNGHVSNGHVSNGHVSNGGLQRKHSTVFCLTINEQFEMREPVKSKKNEMEKEHSDKGKQGSEKQKGDNNPWIIEDFKTDITLWDDKTCKEKIWTVLWIFIRVCFFLGLLYIFVCSLDFLSSAFRLLGGAAAGNVLNDHFLLSNPICGLMIGVLVTVLVQSSSTSTSIVVAMVSADIIRVPQAIPIVMGANIGTSVTNTIVAMGQVQDRDEFRRAFAGATLHDMFNWLSVVILLLIEVMFHYLEALSKAVVNGFNIPERDIEVSILKELTDPFTKRIIAIDKKAITKIAEKEISTADARILKHCKKINGTWDPECDYDHWFARSELSDSGAGLIMLAVSLIILCLCLFGIVKILHSLLKGSIAKIVHKYLNADFPGYAAYFTGYFAILIGAVLTFVVQSSSIFTSAMTPLVGVGVITLDRMYPLTLGSNIGTTATGLIAALASSGGKLKNALQIAICHLFFNITGILIFYPIPFMRWPLPMARKLGNTTANYRWFAIAYLVAMFFIFPAIIIGLSVISPYALLLLLPVVLMLIAVGIINVLQKKKPGWLPLKLRDWSFLPIWCRSLQPYDNIMRFRWFPYYDMCCRKCDALSNDDDAQTIVKKENCNKNSGFNGSFSNSAYKVVYR
ncbi:sodium-dependent phosphate transport protein 2C-like [Amphiura filiformis]|uniref:sodium-dependent phosphate transport protein 2C-like n=1 Tax=Amphiura filiformis TaxID=82378 RepID=UPI003B221984